MQKKLTFNRNGFKLPQVDHLVISLDSDNPISSNYLKLVSQDLQFTTDVVEQRCIHALPYQEKYMRTVYQDLFEHNAKEHKRVVKRLKRSNKLVKHLNCLTKESPPLYKPLPVVETASPKRKGRYSSSSESGTSMDNTAAVEMKEAAILSTRSEKVATSNVLPPIASTSTNKKLPRRQWDEYVLSLLSVNMARFITFELNQGEETSERLERLLIDWYGEPPGVIDLIPEDPSDTNIRSLQEISPAVAKILEKESSTSSGTAPPTDPYADNNQAAFYRLPINMRREKTVVHESGETVNKTATSIEVEHRVMTPPRTMRDFLNPRVGDKCYDTENLYERELLTGGQPVPLTLQGDINTITMQTSHNEYLKQLAPIVPPTFDLATQFDDFALTSRQKGNQLKDAKEETFLHRQYHGMRRWINKPEPVKESMAIGGAEAMGNKADRFERDEKDIELLIGRQATDPRERSSLITIMEEWRQKWFLSQKFADSTVDDLLRDMKDVNPVTRIQAIVTCAKAASYIAPPSEEVKISSMTKALNEQNNEKSLIPVVLLDGIESLLNDSHPNVRQAVAISLYTLGRQPAKAETILRQLLASVNGNDNWAAAQCLIHAGASDEDVIRVVLDHLMTSEDSVIHQRAFHLLSMASGKTKLVHAMVAENMNSSCWRHRVIACKLVPVLQGSINKDLLHKLSELLWCDWHPEVRNAAAQAMGRSGHGRTVHEDLRTRLLTGNEGVRANAVQKLGFLGIMTTRLMPIFINSFHDPYVSVRQEACIAAARLKISNTETLEKLVHLVSEEPIWRVKAHAIKALGIIGVTNDTIKETLIWAFCYENEAAVRAEAIHSLVSLNGLDPNVALIMQDRYFVEDSQMVKSELDRALRMLDMDPNEDIVMMLRIKEEVKRLSTKQTIFSKIMTNEKSQHYRDLHTILIPKTIEQPVTPSPGDENDPTISNSDKTTELPHELQSHVREDLPSFTETMAVINEGVEPNEMERLSSPSVMSDVVPSSRVSPSLVDPEKERTNINSMEEEVADHPIQTPEVTSDEETLNESMKLPATLVNEDERTIFENEDDAEEDEWGYIKPQTDKERNVKSSNSKSRMSRAASSVHWEDEMPHRHPDEQMLPSPSVSSSKYTSSSKWSEVTFPRKLQELIDRASQLETNLFRLPPDSSHIRPVPIEKTATWMSFHSTDSSKFSFMDNPPGSRMESPTDIPDMPMSPHVRKHLEDVDKIEGLDLGPLLPTS